MMYQPQSPRPPHQVLPTMYDLPSEDPREPGLPDEFHEFQPQLLRETFQSPEYPLDDVFIGTDINLYYDSLHTQWYKRPDWFLVLGAARAQSQEDLRLSYVIWQESVDPFLMVELLSPGTEDEDLGQKVRSLTERDTPPGKWEVYERILRVPYYAIFDRYSNHLRVFCLQGTRYREVDLSEQRLWFEEIKLGLGVWEGPYQGAMGLWLRWYDGAGDWLPTPAERAEQESQRAEQERLRAEQESQRAEQERLRAEQAEILLAEERSRSQKLLDQLRLLGVNPDDAAGGEQ
jgi:Uma2 family endonuclease